MAEQGLQAFLAAQGLQALAAHEFGLAEIQSYLFTSAQVPALLSGVQPPSGAVAASAADIHPIQTGGPGVKMTFLPLWAGGTAPTTRGLRDLTLAYA